MNIRNLNFIMDILNFKLDSKNVSNDQELVTNKPNGKQLKLQIHIIQREYTVNKVSGSYRKVFL